MAHNGHLTRIGRDGAKSLGECLTEQFGTNYYPVAFMSYRGAARAWDAGGQIGVIPHDLAPPPSYNIESVMMRATGFPEIAWIRLDQLNRTLQSWLGTPRFVREFGAAYVPDDSEKLRALPKEFAAVVVFGHTTPTTPTPTGVRKAKP